MINHKEYDALIKDFKPKFGNEKHIRISKKIQVINTKEKRWQKTIENGKDGRKSRTEINELKDHLVYLIKNEIYAKTIK